MRSKNNEQERTRGEKNASDAEIDRLKQELSQLRSTNNELERIRGAKDASDAEITRARMAVTSELENKSKQIDFLGRKLDQFKAEKDASDAEIARLKRELEQVSSTAPGDPSASLIPAPRKEGGEPGNPDPWDHGKLLQVAEMLWTEVYHFAALVPMDKDWKVKKLGAFLWILLRFLKAHQRDTDMKEFCLQDLFGKPLQMANQDHFFCGSCIRSYGSSLKEPHFRPAVQEYINDVIIPQRMDYPKFA